ncbi:glycoside hydrolase [Dichotomocladium elegans]|nr:glycoside hydrolase [Dichotomocladium elegans]
MLRSFALPCLLATMVDALDTLHLMGFTDEFNETRNAVAAIDWDVTHGSHYVQVFETVIRYVGGLLSAYELSGETIFVTKTVELVDRLLPAFDTPTGIPYQYMNFRSGKPVKSGFPKGASCLAELGSVQLEFTRLSEITGDWKYHYVGQRVYKSFYEMKTKHPGLFPHLIDADTGEPVGDHITWGGMGDSFYEYLIKQYVMTGGRDAALKELIIQSVRSLQKHLVTSPENHPDLVLLATLEGTEQAPTMEELACFAPGTLLLAARYIPELEDVESLAAGLMRSCYVAWTSTRTGLAPEMFGWVDQQGNSAVGNLTERQRELANKEGVFPIWSSYILRPETIESLFYFYRFTHDKQYQEMAWKIFDAIHTHCRAHSGFSGVNNVDSPHPDWDDRQESFLFAETLKYLYLIYEDPDAHEAISLDKWVFNTEAHPFRITHMVPGAPSLPHFETTWLKRVFNFIVTWLKLIFIPYFDCIYY